MLARYFLKSMVTNKSLWGWGVAFMMFWLVMGAYVFGFRSNTHSIALYNAAVWYSIISLVSASTLATTVAYSTYYGNSALSYAFRFTSLKPSRYIGAFLAGSSAMGILMGGLIMIFTFLFFSNKSGFILTPVFPIQDLVISFLASVFMYLLATVLVITVNNYLGLRNISFVSFVPLLLTYLFGFAQLGVSLPQFLIYASPFTEISDLFFRFYYGHDPVVLLSNPGSGHINSWILLAGIFLWIGILFILAAFLMRRIKSVPIEEARQV